MTAMARRLTLATAAAAALGLAGAAPAMGHGGGHARPAPESPHVGARAGAAADGPHDGPRAGTSADRPHHGAHTRAAADRGAAAVSLRGCHLTVALVPRPAPALRAALPSPPDLTRTFYGPDPLASVWALSCERVIVEGARTGRAVLSLVAVPTGLTDPRAVPLANFFAHRLVRIDTGSRALGLALARRGLPVRLAQVRYRAARPRAGTPTRIVVPGQYRLVVRASTLDQRHDHANRFEHVDRDGRGASLDVTAKGALDRFCFPAAGGCSASLAARPGSPAARVLGEPPSPVRVAFDHEKLARIDLAFRTRRTGG
jgi:hypothetical protein